MALSDRVLTAPLTVTEPIEPLVIDTVAIPLPSVTEGFPNNVAPLLAVQFTVTLGITCPNESFTIAWAILAELPFA